MVCFKSAFSVFKDTFTRAKNWVKELQRQASPNIVIALAGNKADLANKRAVDHQVRRSSDSPTGKSSLRQSSNSSVLFYLFILPGSTSICRWQQLALYGNFSQDCNECQRDFHGDRWAAVSATVAASATINVYLYAGSWFHYRLHSNQVKKWSDLRVGDVLYNSKVIFKITSWLLSYFISVNCFFQISQIRWLRCISEEWTKPPWRQSQLNMKSLWWEDPRRPSNVEINGLFSVNSQEAA